MCRTCQPPSHHVYFLDGVNPHLSLLRVKTPHRWGGLGHALLVAHQPMASCPQESSSWRETARGLQMSGGYDVLLIDFYNHGKSQGIYPFYRCNIETLVAQVCFRRCRAFLSIAALVEAYHLFIKLSSQHDHHNCLTRPCSCSCHTPHKMATCTSFISLASLFCIQYFYTAPLLSSSWLFLLPLHTYHPPLHPHRYVRLSRGSGGRGRNSYLAASLLGEQCPSDTPTCTLTR
jgi:hypothetical protein